MTSQWTHRKGKLFPPYIFVLALMVPTTVMYWAYVVYVIIMLFNGECVFTLGDIAIVLGLVAAWMSVYKIADRGVHAD